MSTLDGDRGAMHDRAPRSDVDDLDAAFGDAVRHAYAHAAKVDELVARRHAKAAAGVVQRGEVGSWWRTAQLANRRRRIGMVTAKAAAVTAIGMVASTGLAAANVLPAPAARAIVRVVTYVGLPVPDPIETAAEKSDVEAPAPVEVAGPTTTPVGDDQVSLAATAESSTSSSTTDTTLTSTSETTVTTADIPATTVTTVTEVPDECVATPTTEEPVVPTVFEAAGDDPEDSTTSTTTDDGSTTTTTEGEPTTTTAEPPSDDDEDACAQGEGLPPEDDGNSTTSSTTSTTVPDETASADDPTPTTVVEDLPASAEG